MKIVFNTLALFGSRLSSSLASSVLAGSFAALLSGPVAQVHAQPSPTSPSIAPEAAPTSPPAPDAPTTGEAPTASSPRPDAADETAVAAGPVVDAPLPDEGSTAHSAHAATTRDVFAPGNDPAAEVGRTTVGGYGELHYNLAMPSEGESEGTIDLHRLVLFVSHRFTDKIRFHTEIEVEHVTNGDGLPGEIGIEQAFVDYQFARGFGLRAGMVLVPMGIINRWHEPPTFHGVERPMVDKVIIPSTWREGGIGIFGEPVEGLRYELYLLGGLNAARFNAESGIRDGRMSAAEALSNGFAVAARVEYEPMLGFVFGGSGYVGEAGPNTGGLQRLVGRDMSTNRPIFGALDPSALVVGLAADARLRWKGLEARAELATFSIGDTAALRGAVDENGDSLGLDVGSRTLGFYVEAAYDVLRLADCDHELLPFVRVEHYDTMASISGRPRTAADDTFSANDYVFGLTYRPIRSLAFKTDFIIRDRAGAAVDEKRFDLGVGWMF